MDDNAPSKIIINGQEYDPGEAQELIDTGRKTRDYEKQYNTNLDKVWPEYNQKSQRLSQVEQELVEAKAQLTEFNTKKKEGVETPQDEQEAKQAAKKLGIVLNEDLEQSGYIKKDELDKYFDERRGKEQEVQAILSKADELVKEIDGSDGRPKFNKKAVLAYASAYGKADLLEAYEEMNEEVIKPWKDGQIASQKAKSLKTLHPGGEKSPKQPKIGNDDNFDAALKEALWGSTE